MWHEQGNIAVTSPAVVVKKINCILVFEAQCNGMQKKIKKKTHTQPTSAQETQKPFQNHP